jgi:hypothetical protein
MGLIPEELKCRTLNVVKQLIVRSAIPAVSAG